MPVLTRIAPTRDDLITQNVQAVESMYRADLRTRAEDVKFAAIEIESGFNIAWKPRRMIPIIPSEANLDDGEQRTPQREVEAVLATLLHHWVAVIRACHRVELRNGLKVDPRTPGCLRVAERPWRV